jgi:hypothetical protein
VTASTTQTGGAGARKSPNQIELQPRKVFQRWQEMSAIAFASRAAGPKFDRRSFARKRTKLTPFERLLRDSWDVFPRIDLNTERFAVLGVDWIPFPLELKDLERERLELRRIAQEL